MQDFSDDVYLAPLNQQTVPDRVVNPSHYARWPVQPLEFIMKNDPQGFYVKGNICKYTYRFDDKDGLTDLYKARTFLNRLIGQHEGIPEFWLLP